jgi:4-carboxymuconolactone decarboxylase
MNMQRVPELKVEELSEQQKRIASALGATRGNRIATRGPWGILLRNPELCERAAQLGGMLRDETSLPKRLSEVAILLCARHWTAQYEWRAHEPQALKAGLSMDMIDAIRHRRRPRFTATDQEAVYEYVVALLEHKRVPDKTYDALAAEIGAEAVIELTAIVGFYSLVAMIIVAFEIPLPEGFEPPLPE